MDRWIDGLLTTKEKDVHLKWFFALHRLVSNMQNSYEFSRNLWCSCRKCSHKQCCKCTSPSNKPSAISIGHQLYTKWNPLQHFELVACIQFRLIPKSHTLLADPISSSGIWSLICWRFASILSRTISATGAWILFVDLSKDFHVKWFNPEKKYLHLLIPVFN